MLLIQIRDWVMEQQEVSLASIANHFNMPNEVMEMMLNHWVEKNIIGKKMLDCERVNSCSSCGLCPSSLPKKNVYYYLT